MGVTVHLYTTASAQHPTWQWGIAGGREVAALIPDLPHTTAAFDRDPAETYYEPAELELIRPSDLARWRAADWPDVNAEHWQEMLDILECEPEYWIYISF